MEDGHEKLLPIIYMMNINTEFDWTANILALISFFFFTSNYSFICVPRIHKS